MKKNTTMCFGSPSQRHASTEHGGRWVKSFDVLHHVLQVGGIGCTVGDGRLQRAEG